MTPTMISACESFAINVMQTHFPNIPVFMTGQAVPSTVSTYVRFWVMPSSDVFQVSITDTSKSRNVGVLQADVYGPKDQGAGPTGDIAFRLAQEFFRAPIEAGSEGWVVLKDSSVVDRGDLAEDHVQQMKVPYRYDFVMK